MNTPPTPLRDVELRALLRAASRPPEGSEADLEQRVEHEIEAAEQARDQPPPPVDAVVGRGLAETVNMLLRMVFHRGPRGEGK